METFPLRRQITADLVYRHLHSLLPPASCDEAERLCDLYFQRDFDSLTKNEKIVVMASKTTPDLASSGVWLSNASLELIFSMTYGDMLEMVAGFYRDAGRWRLNLPNQCIVAPTGDYVGGFVTGLVCVPVRGRHRFFPLSSSRFGGSRAAA
jgi:hypothetical protein